MITLKNEVKTIFKEQIKDSKYTLSRVSIEGCSKYAIAIVSAGECDLELIGGDLEKSERFFRMAVEYELSPIHLKEAVSDYVEEERFFN